MSPTSHVVSTVARQPTRALDSAVRLRDQLGADRIDIIHVVPPAVYFGVYYPPESTAPPETPDWLIGLGEQTPDSRVVLIDSFSNYPPAAAIRWANDEHVDLIVAASHQGAFRRMTVGSFAGYLAYHASCPVLLIPPEMRARAQ